jgi:excisionase family DNA binding protein
MAIWLTFEEAAKHLKIGKSSLYQLAREGGIPAHKYGRVWRFDQEELDGWMKSSGDRSPKGRDDSEKENRR